MYPKRDVGEICANVDYFNKGFAVTDGPAIERFWMIPATLAALNPSSQHKEYSIEAAFNKSVITVSDPRIMNMKAGMGFPYREVSTSLQEYLRDYGPREISMVAAAMYCRIRFVSLDHLLQMDAHDLVHHGLAPLFYMFTKNELTSTTKVKAGRSRAIFGSSTAFQLVERLVFDEQFTLEKGNYADPMQPAKNGHGLHDKGLEVMRGNIDFLRESAARNGREVVSSDCSGFDSRVPFWAMKMTGVRYTLSLGYTTLNNPAMKLFMATSLSMAISSSRHLFVQKVRGMLKSGLLITSLGGSDLRSEISVVVEGSTGALANGDDCLEATKYSDEEFIREYEKCGLAIKCIQRGENLTWCGYLRMRGEPERPVKILGNFLNKIGDGLEPERVFALVYDLRHCPDKGLYFSIAKEALGKCGCERAVSLFEDLCRVDSAVNEIAVFLNES